MPIATTSMLPMLHFASCFVYSPRAQGAMSDLSRLLCDGLKCGDPVCLPKYVRIVHEQFARQAQFQRVFGRDVVLVPVPGSSVQQSSVPRIWAAERLAIALFAMGLAGAVWCCLRRIRPVRRSASSLAGQRPAVQEHYASFAVKRSAPLEPPARSREPERIVLVDDVITKGRTLLAAATRMREVFPHANLQAFALVRTLGMIDSFATLLAPCEGLVRWSGGDARRHP